jgi:hypothetical protein
MTTIDAAIEACGDFTAQALTAVGFKRVRGDIEWQLLTPKIQELLKKMDLGIWRSSAGWWLIGGVNERLHPHERWLYMQSEPDTNWSEINHHNAQHLLLPDLQEELSGAWVNMVLGWSTMHAVHYSAVHYSAAALHLRSAFYKANTQAALAEVLDSAIDPVDLHDLAFHHGTWAARNPEAADMPRELVWRMHGLSEAAKTAAMNRDARMQGLWDDGAFLREGEAEPSWRRQR